MLFIHFIQFKEKINEERKYFKRPTSANVKKAPRRNVLGA